VKKIFHRSEKYREFTGKEKGLFEKLVSRNLKGQHGRQNRNL